MHMGWKENLGEDYLGILLLSGNFFVLVRRGLAVQSRLALDLQSCLSFLSAGITAFTTMIGFLKLLSLKLFQNKSFLVLFFFF
jgi:hypothetical protein